MIRSPWMVTFSMPKAASCARTRSSTNAPLHCCSTSRSCASASAWMRELNRDSNSSNDEVCREVCRAIASTMASRFFERCDSSRMMRRTCASRSSRSLSCCSNTRAVDASASRVRSASGNPVLRERDRPPQHQRVGALLDLLDRPRDAPRRPHRQQHAQKRRGGAGEAGDQDGLADRRLEHALFGGQSHHPSAERRGDMGVGDGAALDRHHLVPAFRRAAGRGAEARRGGLPTVSSWLRDRAMKLPCRSIRPASQPSGRFHCSNSAEEDARLHHDADAERWLAACG